MEIGQGGVSPWRNLLSLCVLGSCVSGGVTLKTLSRPNRNLPRNSFAFCLASATNRFPVFDFGEGGFLFGLNINVRLGFGFWDLLECLSTGGLVGRGGKLGGGIESSLELESVLVSSSPGCSRCVIPA